MSDYCAGYEWDEEDNEGDVHYCVCGHSVDDHDSQTMYCDVCAVG